MKDNFEIFGDNLKTLRKFYNMKQEELAQKSEIPRSNLSYYETGKSEPTLTPLINIANVFDINIDDLVKVKLTIEILREKSSRKDTNSNKTFVSASVFFKKLKKMRLEKKLSQKELAEKIGIGQSPISFYEKGTREPTLTSILKISIFFGKSIDELVSEDININKFTHDELEFFKKIKFDFESIDTDDDFLSLLCNLKKYYLKQSEKLNDIIKVQIPNRIKEIDEIIEFMKHKENK